MGPGVHEVGWEPSFPVRLEAGSASDSGVFAAHVISDAGVPWKIDEGGARDGDRVTDGGSHGGTARRARTDRRVATQTIWLEPIGAADRRGQRDYDEMQMNR